MMLGEGNKITVPSSCMLCGHSFQCTSAILLANKGVDVLGLNGTVDGNFRMWWKDSFENQVQFAKKMHALTAVCNITIGVQPITSGPVSFETFSFNRSSENYCLILIISENESNSEKIDITYCSN